MTRIVRENYPVADLREGFADDASVRITIEPEMPLPERVLTLEELFALRRPPFKTQEEIIAEIRQMRDEWDD